MLGIWGEEAEGANYWLGVLTELRNRGVQDIPIAAVDGLKGFQKQLNRFSPAVKFSNALFIK